MRRAAYMRKNDDARAKILDQLTAEAEEVGDGKRRLNCWKIFVLLE